ncbi:hypothetical protein WEH80_23240 [Actinomycetes bacterium KLBMP 9759]
MSYFVPETEEHLAGAGLERGRMQYFASRSAPMGAVGPSVVTATFYNFHPGLVARCIPAAWALADPATITAARYAAVDAALRRLLGDDAVASPEIVEAAGIARRAAEACTALGRALVAGHLDLEWPVEPHMVLWHAVTILREHRGDGHVLLLLDAELDGLEALVSYTATGNGFVVPFARKSRGWSEEEWDAGVARLRERGLLDADGALTAEGTALRGRIEQDTDRLGAGPYRAIGAEATARLGELGRTLVRQLVVAGAFPDGIFARSR